MFEFLIALSGGIGVIAAALAVIFGHRGDTYKEFGYVEESAKSYKIMWYCYGYIFFVDSISNINSCIFCE